MSLDTNQREELEMKMMDYISGNLSEEEAKAFNQLIADHPEYSQELFELKQMMELVEQHDNSVIPAASEQMDQRFYDMLNAEVNQESVLKNQQSPGLWQRILGWFQLPQVRKLSYGFSFMVVGVFLGHYLHLLNNQSTLEAERIAIKDQQIQALTVLSLLDMPSVNKRLMAVNLASMNENPNESIVDALLATLKQDSNINVRLEALEVLAAYANNNRQDAEIRADLVSSINYQDSPMVQIALANLMLQLNEKQAVEPIQQLLKQPELIEPVRTQLNQTLDELI